MIKSKYFLIWNKNGTKPLKSESFYNMFIVTEHIVEGFLSLYSNSTYQFKVPDQDLLIPRQLSDYVQQDQHNDQIVSAPY